MSTALTDSQLEALRDKIKQQGDGIRLLKANKADPALIKEKVTAMQAKKKQFGEEGTEKPSKFVLNCPKGTLDYGAKAMAVRESVIKTMVDTFKRHGAETIETPVFELREVLLGKYGKEGGKLVYDLQDQGGELLSMRYNLTVPFARFLAMNKVAAMERYHIARVYRRNQLVITRGRYRLRHRWQVRLDAARGGVPQDHGRGPGARFGRVRHQAEPPSDAGLRVRVKLFPGKRTRLLHWFDLRGGHPQGTGGSEGGGGRAHHGVARGHEEFSWEKPKELKIKPELLAKLVKLTEKADRKRK